MGYLTRGATAGGKTYDLLPCPFCGGEAEFRDGSSTKPYIRCKSCGCRTWGSYAYDNLVAAWNRRAERTCHVDLTESNEPANINTWECSLCGMSFEEAYGSYEYCPHCGARVVEERR